MLDAQDVDPATVPDLLEQPGTVVRWDAATEEIVTSELAVFFGERWLLTAVVHISVEQGNGTG